MATPTADYQASVSGLLMGASTPYQFGAAFIDGLGNPKAKTNDVELHGRDGSVGGPDYRGARIFIFHLEILEDGAANAMNALTLLKAAWLPTAAPIDLHIQLPGLGHYVWSGFPDDVEANVTQLLAGRIQCLCTFRALDPQGTPA